MAFIAVSMLLFIGCLTAIIEAVPQSTPFGFQNFLRHNPRWGQGFSKRNFNAGGCMFGSNPFPNERVLKTCLKFTCTEGIWKYDSAYANNCGRCEVGGYPKKIHTWTTTPSVAYKLNLIGEFIITQPGTEDTPLYWVKGKFVNCMGPHRVNQNCINSITYHEPGIDITLVADPAYCNANSNCQIKVLANGENIPVDSTVQPLFGLQGAILVFQSAGITGLEGVNCIWIVGSKGYSMALCAIMNNFPSLYIWAMPTLRVEPSRPHGLCNIYTEGGAQALISRNKDVVTANRCPKPIIMQQNEICYQFVKSWKV